MSRSYPLLEIEEFGKQLLETGDLDPVYIALVKMNMPTAQLKRWLLAYWCFYHCGFASWASEKEGTHFWNELLIAAINGETKSPLGERWPRGSERRHFRGKNGISCITNFQNLYNDNPEAVVDYMVGDVSPGRDERTMQEISDRAQIFPAFGPWIGFKIADMVERVLQVPVDFDEAAVFMFSEPTKAVLMFWRLRNGLPETAQPKNKDDVIHKVVEYLEDVFKDYSAPPAMLQDRPVGVQEIETVLCKWKSHMNGHYPLYNDIEEISLGVFPWINHCKTAESFFKAMPKIEEFI